MDAASLIGLAYGALLYLILWVFWRDFRDTPRGRR